MVCPCWYLEKLGATLFSNTNNDIQEVHAHPFVNTNNSAQKVKYSYFYNTNYLFYVFT